MRNVKDSPFYFFNFLSDGYIKTLIFTDAEIVYINFHNFELPLYGFLVANFISMRHFTYFTLHDNLVLV